MKETETDRKKRNRDRDKIDPKREEKQTLIERQRKRRLIEGEWRDIDTGKRR